MGRELRRVPLDFDWPIGKLWHGFVMGDPPEPGTTCPACEGHGSSPEAKRLRDLWYGYVPFDPKSTGSEPLTTNHPAVQALARRNMEGVAHDQGRSRFADTVRSIFGAEGEKAIEATNKALVENFVHGEAVRLITMWNNMWCHHLEQADVDALVEEHRLSEFTHRPRTPEQEAQLKAQGDGNDYWMDEPNGYKPTAKEVNDWSLLGFGHDSINNWICVKARLARNNLPTDCSTCQGEGRTWPSDEAREACLHYEENWQPTPPPTGEAYQIWSTTTAGHPMSPPFAAPEDLAHWMVENRRTGFDKDTTYEQWLAFVNGPGWAPSIVVTNGVAESGVTAFTSPEP